MNVDVPEMQSPGIMLIQSCSGEHKDERLLFREEGLEVVQARGKEGDLLLAISIISRAAVLSAAFILAAETDYVIRNPA